MKNETLAEAIEIVDRTTMKLPTREHLIALYQELVEAKRIIEIYRRKVDSHHIECTGVASTCLCTICESVRADERRDKMDSGEKNG